MPTTKIYNVFDLGPGDGGKGGVVHKLSHGAHTVIKVGGAQGSHGVSNGKQEFAFSQWGCGTLEGVKTHITPRMVVSPEGLLNEADGLRYVGVTNAFDLLTVDERAICTTAYHGIASRLKELARRNNPRGTIGTGVGEAYRDSVSHPELIIRVSDLKSDLRSKLSQTRDLQRAKLEEILRGSFLHEDVFLLEEESALLDDDDFLDYNVERFREAGRLVNLVDENYLGREVLRRDGVAVVESSHGILTDNRYGFQPHVSAIRTLPAFSHTMLREAGYDGEIIDVGVHRAYTIRHGAGPMPTADPAMNDELLPGSHKEENRWQGRVRVGPLDLVLLRYAIDVVGGPQAINWLAITWFDQINGAWRICDNYAHCDQNFFDDGRIKIPEGDTADLGSTLFKCEPEVTSIPVPKSKEERFRLCDRELRQKLEVPVGLVSFGPTKQDKLVEENL